MTQLRNPDQIANSCITFLQETYKKAGKTKAVIAVSGGIDSAVSLTLLTKALGAENITALLLPYGDQAMDHARLALQHNAIPEQNWQEINIQPVVDQFAAQQQLKNQDLNQDNNQSQATDHVRLGNIMARTRMIFVYDTAKKLNALVCGTENKSEKYLAYFTRFGDEASDIEPIQDLFKTQVRQLAEHLELPTIFTQKPPSAGLWQGQTDEAELGFTYEQADVVLEIYEKNHTVSAQELVSQTSLPQATVQAVISRVKNNHFKHEVPYVLSFDV
jgi:NAD+ synthase